MILFQLQYWRFWSPGPDQTWVCVEWSSGGGLHGLLFVSAEASCPFHRTLTLIPASLYSLTSADLFQTHLHLAVLLLILSSWINLPQPFPSRHFISTSVKVFYKLESNK